MSVHRVSPSVDGKRNRKSLSGKGKRKKLDKQRLKKKEKREEKALNLSARIELAKAEIRKQTPPSILQQIEKPAPTLGATT